MSEPKVLARYEKKTSPVPDPDRVKLYVHLIEKALKGEWMRPSSGHTNWHGPDGIWRWVRVSDSFAYPGDEASFAKALDQLGKACVVGTDRHVSHPMYRYVPDHKREEFRRKKIRLDRQDTASETITRLLKRHGVESGFNPHTFGIVPRDLKNLEELAALLKKHLG